MLSTNRSTEKELHGACLFFWIGCLVSSFSTFLWTHSAGGNITHVFVFLAFYDIGEILWFLQGNDYSAGLHDGSRRQCLRCTPRRWPTEDGVPVAGWARNCSSDQSTLVLSLLDMRRKKISIGH